MNKKPLDIAGQAVVEGVMIKNEAQYAMALRKGNGDIEIIHNVYKGIMGRGPFSKIPILRGIFALIDNLVLGIKLFLFPKAHIKSPVKWKCSATLLSFVMVLSATTMIRRKTPTQVCSMPEIARTFAF